MSSWTSSEPLTAAQGNATYVTPGVVRSKIYYPEHLTRWRTKLADARWSMKNITVFGDSLTEGAYSNNAYPTQDDIDWRTHGYVGQLRRLFADHFGDPGEGACFPKAIGGPYGYTLGGTAGLILGTSGSIGAFGNSATFSAAAATVTINTPACTRIALHYWWAGSGTIGTFTIDGGASTPIPNPGGAVDKFGQVDLASGLSNTTHTVVLTGPSSGLRCMAIGAYQSATGVAVHRIGTSGMVLADCFALASSTWTLGDEDKQARGAVQPFNTDLAILAFSANNVTRGVVTYGLTPATLQAATQATVDRIVATGADVLLLANTIRDPTTYTTTYSQADYNAAYLAVSAATDHVAYMDMADVWGTFAAGSALGLYVDPVHPTRAGHGDIAQHVYQAIGV